MITAGEKDKILCLYVPFSSPTSSEHKILVFRSTSLSSSSVSIKSESKMPSSSSNTFRFRPVVSTLLTMLGVLSPSMLIIYADAAPSSIIEFLRSVPTHEGLGKLIEELAGTVERYYGDSSPLKENSVRTWAFLISRSIHKCTRDVISGSLACSVLISFLLSHDETPSVYVLFALWGVLVVLYLAKHRAPIPRNDSD